MRRRALNLALAIGIAATSGFMPAGAGAQSLSSADATSIQAFYGDTGAHLKLADLALASGDQARVLAHLVLAAVELGGDTHKRAMEVLREQERQTDAVARREAAFLTGLWLERQGWMREAAIWHADAAKAGHELARRHRDAIANGRRVPEKARALYEQGIGSRPAIYGFLLGTLREFGNEPDAEAARLAALEAYRLGAAAGDPLAQAAADRLADTGRSSWRRAVGEATATSGLLLPDTADAVSVLLSLSQAGEYFADGGGDREARERCAGATQEIATLRRDGSYTADRAFNAWQGCYFAIEAVRQPDR